VEIGEFCLIPHHPSGYKGDCVHYIIKYSYLAWTFFVFFTPPSLVYLCTPLLSLLSFSSKIHSDIDLTIKPSYHSTRPHRVYASISVGIGSITYSSINFFIHINISFISLLCGPFLKKFSTLARDIQYSIVKSKAFPSIAPLYKKSIDWVKLWSYLWTFSRFSIAHSIHGHGS
jgi:hypothetical protein